MASKKTRKGIPVKFGTVSYRARVAAVGLKFAESDMPVEDREALLRRAQLEVVMKIDKSAGNDVDGQGRFIDTDLKFEGIGEIHTYTTGDEITCTVSFPIDDTDTHSLTLMRCAAGSIDLKRTGDAEEKKRGRPKNEDGEEDEEAEDEAKGQGRISVGSAVTKPK